MIFVRFVRWYNEIGYLSVVGLYENQTNILVQLVYQRQHCYGSLAIAFC